MNFALPYDLDGHRRYLLWHTDERDDGVLTDEGGFVLTFATEGDLRSYASRLGLDLSAEVSDVLDLDTAREWLANPRAPIDCKTILYAWNVFGDVARSVPVSLPAAASFLDAESQHLHIYEELFRGNNLPAIVGDDEPYDPPWSATDIAGLADTVRRGFELFDHSTRNR